MSVAGSGGSVVSEPLGIDTRSKCGRRLAKAGANVKFAILMLGSAKSRLMIGESMPSTAASALIPRASCADAANPCFVFARPYVPNPRALRLFEETRGAAHRTEGADR